MSDMLHSARDRPLVGHDSDNYNEGGEQNAVREIYPNELVHYGIPGMKWGIRRFQNPDGTLTAAGRRRYGTVENLERGRTKKQADEHEAAKKAAINSGKASEVQKFSSELTDEEMSRALKRITDENKLSELSAKEVSAGQQYINNLNTTMGNIKTSGESFKNAYNIVAQINNAWNKNYKLPIIGNQENDKKGDKPLSIEDQSKLFKLEQDKKKAATDERIDELIQKKGVDYIRDNPDKFTAEELRRAIEYKRAAESKEWGRSDTSESKDATGNTGGSQKNQNQGESKNQTSGASKSQKSTSEKDLPGGIDFTKDTKNSGESEKKFESPAVSTAKTVADLTTKASKFVKDVENSGAPVTSTPTKTGSDWVKDNWENETPFSRFKTTSLSDSGATVDFKGVVFTKETSSSGAYRDAYKSYMDQHPNSEASYDDFVRWQNRK